MIDQIVERLLILNPGLTRDDAVLLAEMERAAVIQKIDSLERDIITAENASRYDARHIEYLKDLIAALRRAVA